MIQTIYIGWISFFDSIEEKKKIPLRSRMHKRCLYGCSILFSFFSFYYFSLSLAQSCEIEEPFMILYQYHQIRVMIHQPASSFYEAQAGEFILEAEELLKLRETLTKVYVQRTGNPLWVVSEDMERDVFMSATEAQAHGIVDLVAVENENTRDFV